MRRLRCPRASFSCVDCSVTFVGTSYRDHTSCISEAEKYQKALYKPKAATGAPSAAAEASPKRPASATKARTTPKADRKKAYWEESTTDDDSDDDSHKKAAAKRRAAAATPEPVAAKAAAPEPAAESEPRKKAKKAAAPAAEPEPTAEPAAEAEPEPRKKAKKAAPVEAEPEPAVESEPEPRSKKAQKAVEAKADTASVAIVELVAAGQLDHAVRRAAFEVVQTHDPAEGLLSLRDLEAKTVKRLQWGGCTVEKKELRETVREQVRI